MALVLRPYQDVLKSQIYQKWSEGHQNVLAVMPTGMGKTKLFCSIAIAMAIEAQNKWPTAIMVHRKELVQQISLTLAEESIMHNIIAPRPVIQGIVAGHRQVLRKQFYDYRSPITVISVDTLNSRIDVHADWAKNILLWITDEATHLLKNNKWGRAVSYFPNAKGLGVTATPQRLDKRGLGAHVDGVFHTMVEGPDTRWGINNGFLCKYKIAIPASNYQDYLKKAGANSDYTKEAMAEASNKSTITGDIVENYIKFANGKQAIVFSSDISSAHITEKKFIEKGIPAKLLTGETDDRERLQGMLDFKEKRTRVLLNVDLFDEGLDVPGIEAVIMGRPTMSLSKYKQMVGRGLRPAPGKDYLILIDHVGNVTRHGLPCSKVDWTLDRIVKRHHKINLIRICSNVECNSPYDRTLTHCPWCGTEAITVKRSEGGGRVGPAQVDGDLYLIDPETLREMEADTHLESPADIAKRVSAVAGVAAGRKAAKNQLERIQTQMLLTKYIAHWAGKKRHEGMSDRSIHKYFYAHFGQTISHALAEPKADMLETIQQIRDDMPWNIDDIEYTDEVKE